MFSASNPEFCFQNPSPIKPEKIRQLTSNLEMACTLQPLPEELTFNKRYLRNVRFIDHGASGNVYEVTMGHGPIKRKFALKHISWAESKNEVLILQTVCL